MTKTETISLRVEPEALLLADALAEAQIAKSMGQEVWRVLHVGSQLHTKGALTRSHILRLALDRGLGEMEGEFLRDYCAKHGAGPTLRRWRLNRGQTPEALASGMDPLSVASEVGIELPDDATEEQGDHVCQLYAELWTRWENGEAIPGAETQGYFDVDFGIPGEAWPTDDPDSRPSG